MDIKNSSRGVVQIGRYDPWYNHGGPTKVGALSQKEKIVHEKLNQNGIPHLIHITCTFFTISHS